MSLIFLKMYLNRNKFSPNSNITKKHIYRKQKKIQFMFSVFVTAAEKLWQNNNTDVSSLSFHKIAITPDERKKKNN